MVSFCVLGGGRGKGGGGGGVGNSPPRKTKNCKSPGDIVTSQIKPCVTYQLAKGANTVSTEICQRGACSL